MPGAAERASSRSETSSDLEQVRRPSPALPVRPLGAQELDSHEATSGQEAQERTSAEGGAAARRRMVARMQASHGNQRTVELVQRLREERRESIPRALEQGAETEQRGTPPAGSAPQVAPITPSPSTTTQASSTATKPAGGRTETPPVPAAEVAAPVPVDQAAPSERRTGLAAVTAAGGVPTAAPAVGTETPAAEETAERTEAQAATSTRTPESAAGSVSQEAAAAETTGDAAAREQAVEAASQAEAVGGAETATATPEAGGAEAAAEGDAGAAATPATPDQDPGFQAVIARVHGVAYQQGHNTAAQQKATEAQAAAPVPANEQSSEAAAGQVATMDAQEPAPFDKESFKAALRAKIAEITPTTKEEAHEFKNQGRAASIQGEVSSTVASNQQAAGADIAGATAQAPDPSSVPARQSATLPPTPAGPRPADVGAEAATPGPRPESQVSLAEESQSLDRQMEEANVTEDQLANSNEPDFQEALGAKRDAQTHADEAPLAYREDEQQMIAGGQTEARESAVAETAGMHSTRGGEFAQVVGAQGQAMDSDAQQRTQVGQRIEGIYQETQRQVEERLDSMEEEVNGVFDTGAEQAKQDFESSVDREMYAYKFRRYILTPGGLLLFAADLLFGPDEEENRIYFRCRDRYIAQMDGVIDRIATAVERGLNEAKNLIAAGRQRVTDYVGTLEGELRSVGEQAADNIQSRFDSLRETVDNRRDQLVDSLAQRYVENLNAIDERISQMQQESRGFIDQAIDAVGGVIEKIRELRALILSVAAQASSVIDQILDDPIGFVGNLVAGIGAGLQSFMANIGTHLQQGLMGWLFGAMAEAGIQMPETFDLKGILSLILQILGLTYANIRARAVNIVGEPIVQALEQGAEVFRILITEGPAGLWQYVQERIGDFKETVLEGIKSFVIERVIRAGITWIMGMLNPASAFVKACMAIYDIVMFFVNRAAQIASLIQAVLGALAAIASGAIGALASAVEGALASALPVAISFLASLLGLGGISQKIREIIERIQAPINSAIDWIINQAVRVVRAIGGLFGGRGRDAEEVEEDDPEKAARVEAGLAAIDQEEQARLEQGEITMTDAEEVAARVRSQHPVFQSITVVDGGGTWDYEYVASPGRRKRGERKKKMAKVPLTFNRKTKYDAGEYRSQLDGQQSGLNAMTVAQWEGNRAAYNARRDESGSGRDPESAHHQRVFREQERERLILERLDEGMSQEDADQEVDTFMRTQAALHDPDQIAGGEAAGVTRLGSRRINSSIGSQWRREIPTLDTAISGLGAGQNEKENLTMNVELRMVTVP